uniref:Uncharacterized protein n=1 Tax=mine drainage metagenome TaxID=410659 RepID=E6QTT8_9ZZZZ
MLISVEFLQVNSLYVSVLSFKNNYIQTTHRVLQRADFFAMWKILHVYDTHRPSASMN